MTASVLPVEPLQAAAFARFGWLIEGDGRRSRSINAGTSERIETAGVLQLDAQGGQPCLAVFRARAQPPGGPWHTLERHRLGSQSFIPLAGTRCLVLVALGDPRPDPATLAAFLVDGRRGYTLHPGVWHHALIALDDGDFVVIERAGPREDCEIAHLTTPVRLALP
ncbi:ureidoglycolate lyase [Caldimonas sp.]|uniref:ureidoglycolate lyase n=1 Tax=Caldimonas sp. TaxID=2838790 RepID=UPI00391A0379